jgi:hypothetical protein
MSSRFQPGDRVRYTNHALASLNPGYAELMRAVCGTVESAIGSGGYLNVRWDGRPSSAPVHHIELERAG